MIYLLNRFWIAAPLTYALTVIGLIAGLRRGGISPGQGVLRAVLAGLPVTVGMWTLWSLVVNIAEAPGAPGQFDGLNTLLGLVFVPCTSALTGATWARRTKVAQPVERGTVIIDDREREPQAPKSGELTLAGRLIPQADETKHFKIIGTTGTGKSTAIRELLTRAIERGDRAVIADPDGSYARHFYDPARGDIILNPFDPRAARWDLFAEIIEPYDADQLALSLIPDYEGPDRNWRGYARTFVTAALRQLHQLNVRDVSSVYSILTTQKEEDLRDLLEGTPGSVFVGKDGGKYLHSVRSIAMDHLKVIEHLMRQTDGEAFSVRKWIREGKGILFLPYKANQIAAIRTVISTWMRLAIFETQSLEEGDHRLWFVVDELDAIGPIDGLKDALARLRKFGGRCILGFQSIAQVRGTYGDTDAQTIVENCANTLILRCSASERGGTAEFASRLIGKREIVRKQLSYTRPVKLFGFLNRTRTLTDLVTTEDAVMASEIEQLPDLSGFLKTASRPEWFRVVLSWKSL